MNALKQLMEREDMTRADMGKMLGGVGTDMIGKLVAELTADKALICYNFARERGHHDLAFEFARQAGLLKAQDLDLKTLSPDEADWLKRCLYIRRNQQGSAMPSVEFLPRLVDQTHDLMMKEQAEHSDRRKREKEH